MHIDGLNEELQNSDWLSKYGDRLYSYARSRLNTEEEIFDVLQDTFLAALESQSKNSKSKFRGESTELTWLMAIMRYKIYDVYRARAKKNKLTASDTNIYEEFANEDTKTVSVPDSAPGPEAIFENKELYSLILECVRNLPNVQASAFTLREIDNLPTKEICNILSITSTNLNVILFRARVSLQKCLHNKGIRNVL